MDTLLWATKTSYTSIFNSILTSGTNCLASGTFNPTFITLNADRHLSDKTTLSLSASKKCERKTPLVLHSSGPSKTLWRTFNPYFTAATTFLLLGLPQNPVTRGVPERVSGGWFITPALPGLGMAVGLKRPRVFVVLLVALPCHKSTRVHAYPSCAHRANIPGILPISLNLAANQPQTWVLAQRSCASRLGRSIGQSKKN